MNKVTTLLAALLLAGGSVMAETPAKGASPAGAPAGGVFPYAHRTEVLDNGLRIILIPMPGSGLVSYYSVVRTGSRDEFEPGRSGFAHFFEHMMFRGTKTYPARAYDSLITRIGADANAYTTDDYTAYHLDFARQDLETVVTLEADRFQNLWYEEAAFQTESGAVYGEYRKGRTDPWEVLVERLQELAFTRHTYGHTTIGYEKDIKAMPTMYAYSQEFFTRYYRPENVVLLVAGDMDADAALSLIKKHYGGWKSGYVPPQIPAEPEQNAPRADAVTYDGRTLPLLMMSWKAQRFDPADRRAVAASLLGALAFGETGALYQRLVLREQTVEMLEADFGFNRDPGLWSVYARVKDPAQVDAVRDAIAAEAAAWGATQADAARLADLKKRLRYSFLMNLDTPAKVTGRLARTVALTGGIEAVNTLYATYDAVTPADIQEAARSWLVPARCTVVTLRGREQ